MGLFDKLAAGWSSHSEIPIVPSPIVHLPSEEEPKPIEGSPLLRGVPSREKQPDFFVPVVTCDLSIKDDLSLLDISPYRLSPRSKTHTLHYNLNDTEITVTGSDAFGLAHTNDYDLVIHMISHLHAEMQAYQRGERPDKPPRKYRPNTWDMLRFLRRDDGKAQYLAIEGGLDRLQGTTVSIRSESNGRRHAKGFGLIDGWDVVSKTGTGRASKVEIGIPGWIYEGVVREIPTLLTLNQDYFLLRRPLAKTLYRLARKTAGNNTSFYTLQDVHQRSGSTQVQSDFARDLRNLLNKTNGMILDYNFRLVKGIKGQRLEMCKVSSDAVAQGKLPLLDTSTYEKVRKFARGQDVYALEAEWRQWVEGMNKSMPDNADAAYINFCKKKCGVL